MKPIETGMKPVLEALKTALQDDWSELYHMDHVVQNLQQLLKKASESEEPRDAYMEILGERFSSIVKGTPYVKGIQKVLPWHWRKECRDISYILNVLEYEMRTGEKVFPHDLEVDPRFRELLESGRIEFERF